jgi:toxin CptA
MPAVCHLSTMSIAVSADILPSRLLRVALAAHAVACIGAALGLVWAGGRFHGPVWLAGLCMLAALRLARAAAGAGTVRRIDISGLGELRLTVKQSMGEAAPHALVQLMPGSTVWPVLLLLLLHDPGSGARHVLVILPDSVAHEQFRKIAVAVMAIARRDNKFSTKHKIH